MRRFLLSLVMMISTLFAMADITDGGTVPFSSGRTETVYGCSGEEFEITVTCLNGVFLEYDYDGSGVSFSDWTNTTSNGVTTYHLSGTFGSEAGTYPVTVSDQFDPTSSMTLNFKVGTNMADPTITVSGVTSGSYIVGETYEFSTTSTADEVEWWVYPENDGFEFIGERDALSTSLKFTEAGDYTIRLYAYNNYGACTKSVDLSITVNAASSQFVFEDIPEYVTYCASGTNWDFRIKATSQISSSDKFYMEDKDNQNTISGTVSGSEVLFNLSGFSWGAGTYSVRITDEQNNEIGESSITVTSSGPWIRIAMWGDPALNTPIRFIDEGNNNGGNNEWTVTSDNQGQGLLPEVNDFGDYAYITVYSAGTYTVKCEGFYGSSECSNSDTYSFSVEASETCMALYNYEESVGASRWQGSDITNAPSETTKDNKNVMYFNAGQVDRLVYYVDKTNQTDYDKWNELLSSGDSRLVGRIYVESLDQGAEGLVLSLLSADVQSPCFDNDNAAFPLNGLQTGQWYEFDIPLSTNNGWGYNNYNPSNGYHALWISPCGEDGYGGYGEKLSSFQVYVDYLGICSGASVQNDITYSAEPQKFCYGDEAEFVVKASQAVEEDDYIMVLLSYSSYYGSYHSDATDGDEIYFRLNDLPAAEYEVMIYSSDSLNLLVESATMTIASAEAPTITTKDDSFTAGVKYVFTASSTETVESYAWSSGTGPEGGHASFPDYFNEQNTSIIFSKSGSYQIYCEVTNEEGCRATSEIYTVSVVGDIAYDYDQTVTFCENEDYVYYEVKAQDSNVYLTDDYSISVNGTSVEGGKYSDKNISFNLTDLQLEVGTYSATINNTTASTTVGTFTIVIASAPIRPTISYEDGDFEVGDTVSFYNENYDETMTYTWSVDNRDHTFVGATDGEWASIKFLGAGEFVVKCEAIENGCTSFDTYSLDVTNPNPTTVCSINGTEYNTLESAMDNYASGDVITILSNIYESSVNKYIGGYDSFTINTNGYTVNFGEIDVMASLTITGGGVLNTSLSNSDVNGPDVLTVDDATLNLAGTQWLAKNISIVNGGTITLTNEIFLGGGDDDGFNLSIDETSSFNVNGKKISGYNTERIASQITPYLPSNYTVTATGEGLVFSPDANVTLSVQQQQPVVSVSFPQDEYEITVGDSTLVCLNITSTDDNFNLNLITVAWDDTEGGVQFIPVSNETNCVYIKALPGGSSTEVSATVTYNGGTYYADAIVRFQDAPFTWENCPEAPLSFEDGSYELQISRWFDVSSYSYSWSSNNEDVATVGADGTVTFVAPGSAEILCSATNLYDQNVVQAQCPLTIQKTQQEIEYTVESVSFCEYSEEEYTVSIEANPAATFEVVSLDGETIGSFADATSASIQISGEELSAGNYTYNIVENGEPKSRFTITVLPRPQVSVTVSQEEICAGDTIQITATVDATEPYSWEWTGSEFIVGTETLTPKDAPTSSGTGWASITVTDANNCSYSADADYQVVPSPSVEIEGSTEVTAGEQVTYTANVVDAITYTWLGAVQGSEQTLTTTFTTVGSQSVICEVTNEYSCRAVDTLVVTVEEPVETEFTISEKSTLSVCQGESATVIITAEPAATFAVVSSDNETVYTAENQGSVSFALSATTTSTYYIVENGTQKEEFTITVKANPTVSLMASKDYACVGDTIQFIASGIANGSFQWESIFDEFVDATAESPKIATTDSGTGTVTCTVTMDGCSTSETISYTVNPTPSVEITGSTEVTAGDEVTYTAEVGNESGITYTWFGSDATISGTTPELKTTFNTEGTAVLYCTVVNEYGCVNADTLEVTVEAAPKTQYTISGDTTFCVGSKDFISITSEEAINDKTFTIESSYNESLPYTISSDDPNVAIIYHASLPTGGYFINILENGETVKSFQVQQNFGPRAEFSCPTGDEAVVGETWNVSGPIDEGATYSYEWLSDGISFDNPSSVRQAITFETAGPVWVALAVTDETTGCTGRSDTCRFTIDAGGQKYFVPEEVTWCHGAESGRVTIPVTSNQEIPASLTVNHDWATNIETEINGTEATISFDYPYNGRQGFQLITVEGGDTTVVVENVNAFGKGHLLPSFPEDQDSVVIFGNGNTIELMAGGNAGSTSGSWYTALGSQARFNWYYDDEVTKLCLADSINEGSDCNNARVRFTFPQTGTYSVGFSISDDGCYSDAIYKNIYVVDFDPALFSIAPVKDTIEIGALNGAQFTLNYDGEPYSNYTLKSDGDVTIDGTSVFDNEIVGTFEVYAEVSDLRVATAWITVVERPIEYTVENVSVCEGTDEAEAVIYASGSIYGKTVTVRDQDGNTLYPEYNDNNDAATLHLNYLSTGTYTFTVYENDVYKTEFAVTVNSLPRAYIECPTDPVVGDTWTPNTAMAEGLTYHWWSDNISSLDGTMSCCPTVTFTEAGTFSATLVVKDNASGCLSEGATCEFEVNKKTLECNGTAITFDHSNANYTYMRQDLIYSAKNGDEYIVNWSGTPNFTGYINIALIDQSEGAAYWGEVSGWKSFYVVEGSPFNMFDTLTIANLESSSPIIGLFATVDDKVDDVLLCETDFTFSKLSDELECNGYEFTLGGEDAIQLESLYEEVAVGNVFAYHVEGVADFTGTIVLSLEEVYDLFAVADEQTYSVVKGESFNFDGTFTVVNQEIDETMSFGMMMRRDGVEPEEISYLCLSDYSIERQIQSFVISEPEFNMFVGGTKYIYLLGDGKPFSGDVEWGVTDLSGSTTPCVTVDYGEVIANSEGQAKIYAKVNGQVVATAIATVTTFSCYGGELYTVSNNGDMSYIEYPLSGITAGDSYKVTINGKTDYDGVLVTAVADFSAVSEDDGPALGSNLGELMVKAGQEFSYNTILTVAPSTASAPEYKMIFVLGGSEELDEFKLCATQLSVEKFTAQYTIDGASDMYVGESNQLTIKNIDGTVYGGDAQWVSTDETVVSVANNGYVYAKSEGVAEVQVIIGGDIAATTLITVNSGQSPYFYIGFDEPGYVFDAVGDEQVICVNISGSFDGEINYEYDASIIELIDSQYGDRCKILKALKPGRSYFRASVLYDGEKREAGAAITVDDSKMFQFENREYEVSVGEELDVCLWIGDGLGSGVQPQFAYDANIISISAPENDESTCGMIKGLHAGQTSLVAYTYVNSTKYADTVVVNVISNQGQDDYALAFAQSKYEITEGESMRACLTIGEGFKHFDPQFTFDQTVISIADPTDGSDCGVITGLKAGQTFVEVIAEAPDGKFYSAQTEVIVNAKPELDYTLAFAQSKYEINEGESISACLTIGEGFGSGIQPEFEFDESVISIAEPSDKESSCGIITGLKAGMTPVVVSLYANDTRYADTTFVTVLKQNVEDPQMEAPVVNTNVVTLCYSKKAVSDNAMSLDHFVQQAENARLRWYDAAGNALTAAPVIDSKTVGKRIYYVAQVASGYTESEKVSLAVNIVYVAAPEMNIYEQKVCDGSNVQPFVAKTNNNVLWYNADSVVVSQDNSFIPTETGMYRAYASDPVDGCVSEATTVTYFVGHKIAPNFQIEKYKYALDETVELAVAPVDEEKYSVVWTIDSVVSQGITATVAFAEEGTYMIPCTIVEKESGCFASDTVVITVEKTHIPVSTIAVQPSSIEMYEGEQSYLALTFTPAFATDKNYVIEVADTAIADVVGLTVFGLKEGTTTATISSASNSDATVTIPVTVKKFIAAREISLPTVITMSPEETKTISAAVLPTNASYNEVFFNEKEDNVIRLSANGELTALAEGTSIITAYTKGGLKASSVVVVTSSVAAITDIQVPERIEMKVGDSVSVSYKVVPATSLISQLNWSIADEEMISFDNGVVKAVKAGNTTLTVSFASIEKSIAIVVNESDAPVVITTPNVSTTQGDDIKVDLSDVISDDNTAVEDLTVTTLSENFNVSVNNGVLTVTPKDNSFVGVDTVTVVITDENNLSVELPVVVEITEIQNQAPEILMDTIMIKYNACNYIQLSELVSDDFTPYNKMKYSFTSNVKASVMLRKQLRLFTDNPDLESDILTMTVTDADGVSTTKEILLLMTALPNKAPKISEIPTQNENDSTKFGTIDLAQYVKDDYTSSSAIAWTAADAENIAVTISEGKATIKVLNEFWNGAAAVTFYAKDEEGLTDSTVVYFVRNVTIKKEEPSTEPSSTVVATWEGAPAFDFMTMKTIGVPGSQFILMASCSGYECTWSWDIPEANGVDPTSLMQFITFDKPGTYDVTFTVQSPDGNFQKSITKENFLTVVGINERTPAICKGDAAILTATEGLDSYYWSTGDAKNTTTDRPETTTLYQLTMKKGMFTLIDTVTVKVSVPVALMEDSVMCKGTTFDLEAQGEYVSYTWNTGESTKAIALPDVVASYSVMAVDDMQCVSVDTFNLTTVNELPIINLGPDQTPCDGTTVTLDAGEGYEYLWSNSSTEQTITLSQGTDTVWARIIDNNLCVNYDTVVVAFTYPYPEQLGVATASETTDHVILAWEKTAGVNTQSYVIERETYETDRWDPVGDTVKFSQPGLVVDEWVNSKQTAYKYRLVTIDGCGNKAISEVHRTMHSMRVQDPETGLMQLHWTGYEPIRQQDGSATIKQYIILRGTEGNMDSVGFIPASSDEYIWTETDASMTDLKTIKYRVAFRLNHPVNENAVNTLDGQPVEGFYTKAESGPFSLALSNIAELETLAVDEVPFADVIVYPTTFSSFINVAISADIETNFMIEVVNANGQVVTRAQTGEISKTLLQIPADNFKQGIYTVKISDGQQVKTIKVVK